MNMPEWTPELEEKLDKLLAFADLIYLHDWGERVEIRNVTLATDQRGATSVVEIDGRKSVGWQVPIAVKGTVKCIICDQATENKLICTACRNVILDFSTIRLMRSAQIVKLYEALDRLDSDILETLLRVLTDDGLRRYFTAAIKDMENDA